jgi:hypothetical protein
MRWASCAAWASTGGDQRGRVHPVAAPAVNIEHEDQAFNQIDGLRLAADNLLCAVGKIGLR